MPDGPPPSSRSASSGPVANEREPLRHAAGHVRRRARRLRRIDPDLRIRADAQTFVSPLIGGLIDRYGFEPVCLGVAGLPLAAVGRASIDQRAALKQRLKRWCLGLLGKDPKRWWLPSRPRMRRSRPSAPADSGTASTSRSSYWMARHGASGASCAAASGASASGMLALTLGGNRRSMLGAAFCWRPLRSWPSTSGASGII